MSIEQVDLGRLIDTQKIILEQLALIQANVAPPDDVTPGERLAGRLAGIIGNWWFLLGQTAFIVAWTVLNGTGLINIDHYPFILLNLIISMQAASLLPVILISQNQAERRDRRRADNAYRTISKIEAQMGELHERVRGLGESS